MRKMKNYLIWNLICTYQDMSEDFMSEMNNYLDWWVVSSFQTLSEEFMDKWKDKIIWSEATYKQDYSEQFAWDHIDYLDVSSLFKYNTEVFHPTPLSDEFYRAAVFNYWNNGNRDLLYPSYNSRRFGKDFIREVRHIFNDEIFDLYDEKDKEKREEFFLELRDQITDNMEWKFFVINNLPSVDFIKRFEERIGLENVPIKKYSEKEQEELKKFLKEETYEFKLD